MDKSKGLSADIARRIKPSYYENYYGEGIPFTSETAYWNSADFVEGIRHFIDKEDMTFLDMGAGTGAIVKLMREYGVDAEGYELNRYALDNAEIDIIERDITEPFLKEYDVVYSNAFMYFSTEDFHKFFKNNRDKFKVLVLVYPFDGNGDEYRVNMLTRQMFYDIAKEYQIKAYNEEVGWLVMIKEEDVDDLPFR